MTTWTSVKEGLPKKKGYYLLATVSVSQEAPDYITFQVNEDDDHPSNHLRVEVNQEIARWDGTCFCIGSLVLLPTHWMSTFEEDLYELLKKEFPELGE